ncbi:methyl-accepting chemotaxis protein [Sphingomonas sp. HF-S4]|uniref:Methyl-accepting chemotaxis protein n=1 Tax=Sphingomonas agrestis TaxID=3080540 RepID=A0ABU3YDB0_9SPHN|nr:methyl-accepting chemotaxis protein [Sphingomonas sp. HF-S4]MDV3459385.1 methyl-accepting chemotaxis protein [Sphingomonas sp. HF-S4]
MSLQNIPISRKLAGAFAALIVIFAGVGTLIFLNLSAMADAGQDKERSLRALEQTQAMMTQVLEQQNAARGFAILGKEEFAKTYQESGEKFFETVKNFKEISTLEEQHKRADQLVVAVQELRGKLDRIITLARNPATRAEAGQLSGVKMLGDIRPLIKEIGKAQEERVEARVAAEAEAIASSKMAIYIGGAFAVGLSILLGWLLSRGIAAPVAQMTGVMNTLASGNNKVDVPGTDRGDEIGAMAKAVLVFREAAIEKQKTDAAKKISDAEQQRVVSTLEVNLSKLALGDLTSEINEAFSPEYESVKINFNAAVNELRSLIGTVTESALTIRTGSGEIAQASEDLARRTEANAASLEETSAAVTQMDGRLKATAASASRTVERADGAIATVSGGRAVADEAVQAMSRVADGAKGIDSVIEGLDKIAFQTRVLAMNAAVEAGRAGEAGRGFAVVADLVSALAMRSEEEAARARDQLTATQTDIVSAVEMVQKVDSALADIAGDVGEVHGLLGQMAADNQAQSTAITEISVAIGTMDQSTQQNAAMVEQTSAAARNLSGEVAALSEQASKFNVGNAARPAARTSAPAAKAAAPAKSNGYVSPVKALPVTAMASSGGDDWASF